MIILSCTFCKTEFEVETYKPSRPRKFCSHSCSNRARVKEPQLSKPEYDKRYRQLNLEKLTNQKRVAYFIRQSLLGESYKKSLLNRAKNRASAQKLPFSLELEDIIIPNTCPVLGIPLNYAKGAKGGKDNSPSLDRITPSLGYTKENVIIVSNLANRIKTNANLDQIKRVYDFYLELSNSQAGKKL